MLTDMKLTKKETKEHNSPTLAGYDKDGPRYPYGLQINLESDALEKLGMEMPKIGAEMRIEAIGCVTSVSSNDRQGEDGPSNRVEIQIQRLQVAPAKKKTMQDAVDEGIEEASE
jgi:hypothetical protein